MKTEQSNSRDSGTVLGHPPSCLRWSRQSVSPGSDPKHYYLRSDAARDIGLPLYEILAMADQMREAYGSGNLECLENRLSLLMSKSANFATSLSAIIELARLETASTDTASEIFDIVELLQETSQTARLILGDKPVKIMDASSPFPLFVRADRAKIRQIMTGIMSNAAKFTYRGRIAVIINKYDDHVRLTITDTGIGMTSEQIDLFFRDKDDADNGIPMTGRGLRMIRSLIALLKGSLTVSSRLREGTIVEVSLPIGQPERIDSSRSMHKGKSAARTTL